MVLRFITVGRPPQAAPASRGSLIVFGIGLIWAATWSNAPIQPDIPADTRQHWLHPVAPGVVDTAFALVCLARIATPGAHRDPVAWTGQAAAVLISLLMSLLPDIAGLLQRLMFSISFVAILRFLRYSEIGCITWGSTTSTSCNSASSARASCANSGKVR